jgi:3-hydroxyisobutyrate dehydrogenase-like beta-hydroxyacid dehydrogenase
VTERLGVAFLGLGTMGAAMATNLARAGLAPWVWNRSPGKVDAALAAGAKRAPSPCAAAATADLVITMLTGPEAVEEVLFGSGGAATGDVEGKLFADMSTSGPRSARETAARLTALGARFVDAPVSGSRAPAERGELLVLAGGAPEDVTRLEPVFRAVGRRTLHAGPVGAGQALKIVLNGLGCQQLVAFASMLRLGERVGLSREVLVEAFTSGAFATPSYVGKRQRVLERRYQDPDFVLELVLRDAELCAQLQRETSALFPTHIAALTEVRRAVDAGLGSHDLFGIELLYDAGGVP